MKKQLRLIIKIGILNLLVFLLVIIVLAQNKTSNIQAKLNNLKVPVSQLPSQTANPTKSQEVQNTSPSPTPKDLFSELVSHNSASSCWISYRGHIYDITSYFGSHPGGDPKLLAYCGKDATLGFETKDVSPGKTHSAGAMSQLEQLMIQ